MNEKGTILIVDDTGVNRAVLGELLCRHGYQVQEAKDGHACLALCEESPPDIVLLDIMMPGISGFDVCETLRRQYPKDQLPIVFVSSLEERDTIRRCLALGANDYIAKPVQHEIFLARVENQLAVSHYYCELRKNEAEVRKLERENAEKIKLETVSRFAVGVAHNFNNIMASILGATDLLNRLVSDKKGGERCLEVIRNSIENGTALTQKLSVLVHRKLQPTVGTNDCLRRVVRTVADVQSELEQGRIAFHFDCSSEVPPVNVDATNLIDIVSSVVSNAVDATEGEGVVELTVSWPTESPFVQVIVTDHGIGMDEETLSMVFLPFFSTKNLDQVNQVSMSGNGLGMWNVYNLLKACGGEIRIESRLGQGTSVVLNLPLR